MEKIASNRKTLILGLIDSQSLTRTIPRAFHVLGDHEHEYVKGEICRGKKVSYRGELVEATRIIQDCIKRKHYALLWNNTQIAVIFKDAVFIEHKPLRPTELELIIAYGKRYDIERAYFKAITKDIKDFYKEDPKHPVKKLASSYIINQAGKD